MPPETSQPAPQKNLSIPVAIVLAGALIAGAIYFVNKGNTASPTVSGNNPPTATLRAITSSDHILGNPKASIVIVEYTDLECPFCKSFHATMHTIMNEFGADGKVAWVVRNAPIPQLHAKAMREHEAAECVAELGGNEKYWAFIDKVFAITPSNDGLDAAQLPKIAGEIGIDAAKFQTCLNSGKHQAKIQADFNEGLAASDSLVGPNQFGTPFSVMIVGDQKLPISGAQPLTAVRSAIQSVLAAQESTAR